MKNFIERLKNALHSFYSFSEADFMIYSLLEKVCSISKIDVLSGKSFVVSPDHEQKLWKAVEDLQSYKALQYVLGEAYFCGNYFDVSEAVLIPRPETEELVHLVSQSLAVSQPRAKILDIGTGSGCIAVSLALALPQSQITALDFSEEALSVAKKNEKKNESKNRFYLG